MQLTFLTLLLSTSVLATTVPSNDTYVAASTKYPFEVTTEHYTDADTVLPFSVSDEFYEQLSKYADFAALAYCTKRNSINTGRLQEACANELCTDSVDDITVELVYTGTVNCAVFRDTTNQVLYFAIKGTTSNEEWLMDFKIMPIPYHPLNNSKSGWKKFLLPSSECKLCLVHKGFYEGAKEIYDNVFEQMLELMEMYPDYEVKVVGHSLGGALAPFIGTELLKHNPKVVVASFGSPKIGNKAFSKWMDDVWDTENNYDNIDTITSGPAYIRVSHKDDIVPLLPTRQMGYKHSGVDIYFNVREVPMLAEHIELRQSPSRVFSTGKDIIVENISSKEEMNTALDSHRVYIRRMNQCVKKIQYVF